MKIRKADEVKEGLGQITICVQVKGVSFKYLIKHILAFCTSGRYVIHRLINLAQYHGFLTYA